MNKRHHREHLGKWLGIGHHPNWRTAGAGADADADVDADAGAGPLAQKSLRAGAWPHDSRETRTSCVARISAGSLSWSGDRGVSVV